ESLTGAGITFWMDEKGIVPGEDFAAKILKHIKACRVFVFISSVSANQSEWTRKEIACALMYKKHVIPVLLDDSPFDDAVMMRIVDLDRIDYYENPQQGISKLIHSISIYLEKDKADEAKIIADEKLREEELERQRRKQEEEKKRQEQIDKIETEIAALEVQRTERKKVVLQKEQELKLAQVDWDECETKLLKLQKKLKELRESRVSERKNVENKKKKEENKQEEVIRARYRLFTVGNVPFKMVMVEGGPSGTFYIGETQVTQALWKATMGANPSFFHGPNRPVESVSWNDCQGFIQALNKRLYMELAGMQFRLPRESEWEFAAKGGNKSQGYAYSGCDAEGELEQYAWYEKNARFCGSFISRPNHPDYGTHDVMTRKPNELELYDMSGNVEEWCEDAYVLGGLHRVIRGGGWTDEEHYCRVDFRFGHSPDYRNDYIGFRLVLV
ncbi:MAG: SUMF1/EgtB/PvdO family nonheme iron enzyme, partial [Bacteroidales bacterium]|nr:SUMF1/EgtB/PvdO family nonheme iron enzyme [Bacteroidales bacterium]